jgi:hypothetical protein
LVPFADNMVCSTFQIESEKKQSTEVLRLQ